MGVIVKHTLKNMFSKPFRAFMLILCILICSFAGMMTFDMSNSIKNILESAFLSMFGDSNVMVTSAIDLQDSDFEGLPAHDKTLISANSTTFNVPGNTTYKYFNEKSILVYGVNIEDATKMHLFASDVDLQDNEVAIPKALSEEVGLKVGDTIELNDLDGQPHAYTVKSILSYKGILSSKYNVAVTVDGFKTLLCDEEIVYNGAYVHVHDRDLTGAFCEQMEEKTQGVVLEDLINGEMVTSQVNSITSLFAILFMICLMLVIFVTISLSERIMVERMGTVGTLRSLGVSPKNTSLIVLFENALYGLLGGVLGTVLYVLTRDPIFNNVFTLNSGSDMKLEMNLGSVSWISMVGVIIGAIVIECLCPIKELTKATRTSIRDLIFDNKETDYKYSKKTLVASILFTVLAITGTVLVLSKTVTNITLIFVSILLFVAGLFLGFPFILRAFSVLMENIFKKMNCPIAAFSCVQARTKKSSVGISRLFAMAVAIGLTLFVLSGAYISFVTRKPANADVVVNNLTEESSKYSYFNEIDGVSDVEFFNFNWGVEFVLGQEDVDKFETANSKEMKELTHNAVMIGTEGAYKLNTSIKDLPEKIGDNEIYMDKDVAEKLGYHVGDEIPMILGADRPDQVKKTLKLSGYCNTLKFASGSAVYVVSLNNYNELFKDHPTRCYIKTTDPEGAVNTIKERSGCMIESCQTMEDYMKDVKAEGAGLMTLLYMLIGMGVLLTFIAVVSNQIIGFSGRRRECAVLVSTAMNRGKLKKAFLSESLISCLLAMGVAVAFSTIVTILFQKALEMLEMNFGLTIDPISTAAFLLGLFLIFVLTVLMPIKNIRKMKIAEQLKYE
ncbi:MAG: ABC transporter permease [Clostridiales bacterium]|nr:ABC transporter permease [Clostridiales bacterium]